MHHLEMKPITAREIQVFVAGALALMGLRSIYESLITLIFIKYSPSILYLPLIGLIPLLLGLAIFYKSENAVKLSKIVLSVLIVSHGIYVTVAYLHNDAKPFTPILYLSTALILEIILYCLLFWSTSLEIKESKSNQT